MSISIMSYEPTATQTRCQVFADPFRQGRVIIKAPIVTNGQFRIISCIQTPYCS